MRCQACRSDIPANLRASIDSNFCPFCGKQILSKQQIDLKTSVLNAVKDIKDPADAVAVVSDVMNIVVDSYSSTISKKVKKESECDVSEISEVEENESVLASQADQQMETHDVPGKGGRPIVPAHLRPQNKRPMKPVSRDGSPVGGEASFDQLPASGGGEFSIEDLTSVLPDDLTMSYDGNLGTLDDGAFFASGEAEFEGDPVLFGAVSDKASALKERYMQNKKNGLGPKVNKPVSRLG